jgi:peptidoglycan/xylan/chitin deacetylase (PgdA/CDA1 family)
LRPLVDSGQIALGNHTWSPPYLSRIPLAGVEDQIRRNADFLTNTYGVDGRPYFRPPYGVHTPDTDRVAADLGYPTIAMWSSTVGDSRPENEASLIANANANAALQPQQIVLAHANLPTITHCFAQLSGIITTRNLQTVTLNDVFG